MKVLAILLVGVFSVFAYAGELDLQVNCHGSWRSLTPQTISIGGSAPDQISLQLMGTKKDEQIPFGERTIIRWHTSGKFRGNMPESEKQILSYTLDLKEITKQKGGDGFFSPKMANIGQVTGRLEVRLYDSSTQTPMVLGIGAEGTKFKDKGAISADANNVSMLQALVNQGQDVESATLDLPKDSNYVTVRASVDCELVK